MGVDNYDIITKIFCNDCQNKDIIFMLKANLHMKLLNKMNRNK